RSKSHSRRPLRSGGKGRLKTPARSTANRVAPSLLDPVDFHASRRNLTLLTSPPAYRLSHAAHEIRLVLTSLPSGWGTHVSRTASIFAGAGLAHAAAGQTNHRQ